MEATGQAVPNISVWLIEDNHTFRKTLVRVLSQVPGITCARHFANAEDALEALAEHHAPDVFLLDVELPGASGIEAIGLIRAQAPLAHILILSVFDDEDKVFRAVRAGASGYLLKTSTLAEIAGCIREVMTGGAPMSPKVARSVLSMFAQMANPEADHGLTSREQEVLELMTKGLIKKEIADTLALSYHTVDTHIRNIYAKLHVHTSASAVAEALRKKLV